MEQIPKYIGFKLIHLKINDMQPVQFTDGNVTEDE